MVTNYKLQIMEVHNSNLHKHMNFDNIIPDKKEINIQRDFPQLAYAVSFYMKKGFVVTYNSTIKWKNLQYCDWHQVFSQNHVKRHSKPSS